MLVDWVLPRNLLVASTNFFCRLKRLKLSKLAIWTILYEVRNMKLEARVAFNPI